MAKFIFITVRFPNQDVMRVKEGAIHNYTRSIGVIQVVPGQSHNLVTWSQKNFSMIIKTL